MSQKVIRIDIITEDETSGKRSLYSLEEEDANKVLLIAGMENLYNQLERFKILS